MKHLEKRKKRYCLYFTYEQCVSLKNIMQNYDIIIGLLLNTDYPQLLSGNEMQFLCSDVETVSFRNIKNKFLYKIKHL